MEKTVQVPLSIIYKSNKSASFMATISKLYVTQGEKQRGKKIIYERLRSMYYKMFFKML